MPKLKISDTVILTENAKNIMGYPEGLDYVIMDILEEDIEYPIVVNNTEHFGKDWRQFFKEDELIKI